MKPKKLVHENPLNTIKTALYMVYELIASAQRALQLAQHRTMGVSPGTMVFERDMLLHIDILTELNITHDIRQAVIYENNHRHNIKKGFKYYHIRDEVLISTYDPASM